VTAWSVEPPLRDPLLVAAFEGWNDAANAATDALRFLIRQLNATDLGGVDAEEYFDFQAARPQVEIVRGVVRRIRWPATRFAIARVKRADRDLVLVLGVEPNLRWPAFCREVLSMATDLGCSLAVTLGALLGDAPHSRPVVVTGTASDPQLAQRLGLERSRYEGPTGIVGVLTDASRRAGLPTVSLWAPVPHYVATPPNPKATHALLQRLETLTAIPLPLYSLEVAARGWEQHVHAAIDDDDVRAYVHELERRYDDPSGGEADRGDTDDGIEVRPDLDDVDIDPWDDSIDEWGSGAFDDDDDDDDGEDDDDDDDDDDENDEDDAFDEDDLPSGDAIARELERYLRDRGHDDNNPGDRDPGDGDEPGSADQPDG